MGRAEPHPLGVVVITSSGLVEGRGHRVVALAAIEGGADCVQLRAKELRDDELRPLARELADICRQAAVRFIVNDGVVVALESGADGVHLGQDDDPSTARSRLGPGPVLGVSVATPGEARAAEATGADYVGVTVFATATKPEAAPVGLDRVREIAAATSLPIVGIGGIDAANAGDVLAAGANGVAVISAVGAASDPVDATRALVRAVHGVAP
ncbi:MAG: thiamine phosphate synthase [Actinomycetota bacterium]